MSEIYSDITKDPAFTYPKVYTLTSSKGTLEFPAESAMKYFNVKKMEEIKYNQVLSSLNEFYQKQYNTFREIINQCTYKYGDNNLQLKDFGIVKDISKQLEKEAQILVEKTANMSMTKYPSREVLLEEYRKRQETLNSIPKIKRDKKFIELGKEGIKGEHLRENI